jgi:hypothetical protein
MPKTAQKSEALAVKALGIVEEEFHNVLTHPYAATFDSLADNIRSRIIIECIGSDRQELEAYRQAMIDSECSAFWHLANLRLVFRKLDDEEKKEKDKRARSKRATGRRVGRWLRSWRKVSHMRGHETRKAHSFGPIKIIKEWRC